MPSGNLALRNRQLTPRDSKHGHDSVRVRSLLRSSVIAFSASFEQVPTLCGNHRRCPGKHHERLIGIVSSATAAREPANVAKTIALDRLGHGLPC